MREETTRYGRRVHYAHSEVPAPIGEAREMFWEPFYGWKAWLTCGNRPGEPYMLRFRVHGKYVFIGDDYDIVRLLDTFQAFVDENINRVDQAGFPCHHHTPEQR